MAVRYDDKRPKPGRSAEEMFQKMKDMMAHGEGNDNFFHGPFAETESNLVIGGLTVQSKSDRISFSGSLRITKDEEGLRLVKQLREIVEEIHLILDDMNVNDELPYRVPED
jgi:hypothetical protein